MGTEVMVRATQTFDSYIEGEWYYVDPDNARVRALLSAGRLAHQEALSLAADAPALRPAAPAPRRKVRGGPVEAQPGTDHQDGAD